MAFQNPAQNLQNSDSIWVIHLRYLLIQHLLGVVILIIAKPEL